MNSFIFGGNTPMNYQQLQRQREIADQLRGQNNGTPRNVGEGLAAIGRALSARMRERRADKREGEISQEWQGLAASGQKLSPMQMKVLQSLGVPGYQAGTRNHPGGPAIVGEAGPELLNLPRGAQVQPQTDMDIAEFMRSVIDQKDPSEFYRMPLADVAKAFQWQDAIDPSVAAEWEHLGEEDRIKVIDKMIGDPMMKVDEALRPDGYDPHQMLQQEGALQGAGGSQTMIGDDAGDDLSLPYGDAKLTEAQSKDVGFFRRGTAANMALDDSKMESALTQYTDSFAEGFGAVGRAFQDEDYQMARRAANEFLAVILRKDTGAAVTDHEFDIYGKIYLPMPGDKPAVVKAKREARKQALVGLEMGLGTAAPLAQRTKEDLAPKESDEEFMKRLGL